MILDFSHGSEWIQMKELDEFTSQRQNPTDLRSILIYFLEEVIVSCVIDTDPHVQAPLTGQGPLSWNEEEAVLTSWPAGQHWH